MPAGGIRVLAFSQAVLDAAIAVDPKVRYLHGYLKRLEASAVVVEDHYVDRHFLDEYAQYYSKSFNPPDAHCKRLHFFTKLTTAKLEDLLDRSPTADRREPQAELQANYLGFLVRRPLTSAPIGRTVLLPYPREDVRKYEVLRKYRIHLLAFRLEVPGLAYQEQDRGAAVCASTALWSALQRVAQVSGHRTPTPVAVTRAANSPFPASNGLDLGQMATALAALGYSADHFAPMGNRPLFRAKLIGCLESALPVILLLHRRIPAAEGRTVAGHAVTVTGYRGPLSVVDVPSLAPGLPQIPMMAASAHVLYVHDDNLGSHAHYEIFDSEDADEQGHRKVQLARGQVEKLTVSAELAPRQKGYLKTGQAPSARPAAILTANDTTSLSLLEVRLSPVPGPGSNVRFRVAVSADLGATWHPIGEPMDATSARSTLELSDAHVSLSTGYQVALFAESSVSQRVNVTATLKFGPSVEGWPIDVWDVVSALVPKPDKVRLAVEELFYNLVHLQALIERRVFDTVKVNYGARFSTGVEYREATTSMALEIGAARRFHRALALPRHVGVISVRLAEAHLCDLVVDVTEVSRDTERPSVLVIVGPGVPDGSEAALRLADVARRFKCMVVPAPPTTT